MRTGRDMASILGRPSDTPSEERGRVGRLSGHRRRDVGGCLVRAGSASRSLDRHPRVRADLAVLPVVGTGRAGRQHDRLASRVGLRPRELVSVRADPASAGAGAPHRTTRGWRSHDCRIRAPLPATEPRGRRRTPCRRTDASNRASTTRASSDATVEGGEGTEDRPEAPTLQREAPPPSRTSRIEASTVRSPKPKRCARRAPACRAYRFNLAGRASDRRSTCPCRAPRTARGCHPHGPRRAVRVDLGPHRSHVAVGDEDVLRTRRRHRRRP